jgi:indole-3-glycerol phosphate synthase
MILEEIARRTRLRVERRRTALPFDQIQDAARAQCAAGKGPNAGSFAAALAPQPGRSLAFICEIKRASPSKGIIAEDFPYRSIALDYEAAGAAALSVLTEPEYFLGDDRHLREIAAAVSLPLLRKDFIIDPYQIYEAALLGAAAALLIAALLDTKTLAEYQEIAGSLGLDALVEIHSAGELQSALESGARIVGINNRDLRTFQVDMGTARRLRRLIPPGIITVAESGVQSREDIRVLEDAGIDAALIGETLMRSADKKSALAALRGA